MAAESVHGEGVLRAERGLVSRTRIALLCASNFVRRVRAQVAGQVRVRHATEWKISMTAHEVRRADLLEPAAVERACLVRILLAGANRRAARFVAILPPHHWAERNVEEEQEEDSAEIETRQAALHHPASRQGRSPTRARAKAARRAPATRPSEAGTPTRSQHGASRHHDRT